jgi:putative DNA primase/helicase
MSIDIDGRGTEAPKPEGVTASNPCSDVSNGQRYAHYFERDVRHVPGVGWLTWGSGGPWRRDGERPGVSARGLAHTLGSWIARDEIPGLARWIAEARDDKDELARREKIQAERIRWAAKSEQSQRVDAMMREAQVYLAERGEMLDADPMLLACRNGVVELTTGMFRQHRRSDMLTLTAGCDYDPHAACPQWERFIDEIFARDAALIEWVQRLLGYCLSGRRDEHILPICWGSGANGKSTMLDTLTAMLGDYAGAAAPGLLVERHHEHPTGLADLQGRRFVVTSESGEGGRLAEDIVKRLTGGDRIKARKMHQDFFEFSPSHQIFLATNHKPRVAGGDYGIWRRLRLIPFVVQFSGASADTGLKRALGDELPGILQWCLTGWRAYLERGLRDEPPAVRAATDEYRDSEDVVRRFVAERCGVGTQESVRASELYECYRAWCEAGGERPLSRARMSERLEQAGYRRVRSNGTVWHGVSVRAPD